ncbi:MAG: hypothetical protein HOY78_16240 [Saccharothrix sp.]|jgi:hypothetical protein|nr:hypothetical protein [Saccharothrix sp.]
MRETLTEWQTRTGTRLLAGTGTTLPSGTPAQRAGWPVTLALHRQWRLYRIRTLAPLTFTLLGPDAEDAVDAYFAATPSSTSYAATDAAGFLRHIAATRAQDPYFDEITFLELALLRVRRPADTDPPPPPGRLRRSTRSSARLTPFDATPLVLWLAGRRTEPPPRLADGGGTLVAPAVPGWIRRVGGREVRTWEWLATDRPQSTVGEHRESVAVLRQWGAVLG